MHHTEGSLFGAYSLSGWKSMVIMAGSMAASRQAGVIWSSSWNFTSWYTTMRQKGHTGVDIGFWNLKVPPWQSSFKKATPLNPSQIVPQKGNQVFKYMEPIWSFLFQITLGCIYVWVVWAAVCHSTYMEVRGLLAEISFFLVPCMSWEFNSGHQI